MNIYAYSISDELYALGEQFEKELIQANVNTYLASVYNSDIQEIISFYFEDHDELKRAKDILRYNRNILSYKERECGDDCWYLDCIILL